MDGIEEVLPFLGIANVGLDEQGICFGMDIFHHDLKAVETAGFGHLDFIRKTFN